MLKAPSLLKKEYQMILHFQIEKDGEILLDRYEKGHSWTRNAYHFFHNFMIDGGYNDEMWLRTSNGYIYADNYATTCPGRGSSLSGAGFFNSGATNSYGILVGTGTTAFDLDDYCLVSKIAHGNSASQLYHQAQIAPVLSWDGNPNFEMSVLHTRVFNNNSGGTITVGEVGFQYYAGTYSFLLSRDVLAAPLSVVNAAQLTISVQITTQSLASVYPIIPALGALGSGGIYIGQFDYRPDNEAPGSHRKYGLILSPKSGGEQTVQWRNPAALLASAQKGYYGGDNTTALIALGDDSPLGKFVSAQNAAALGGFSDWYVPAISEMEQIYLAASSIPGGEACTNEYYWSSTCVLNTNASVRNPITNASTNFGQTTSYKTRLIRRFLISTWTPL